LKQKKIKMEKEKQGTRHTKLVSDSFERTDEKHGYEIPFRRWLVREIEEGRITVPQAIERFNLHPKNGIDTIRYWRAKYAPEMVLSLPEMTEKEKQELSSLQKQVKALAKQLEESKMRNIALDMLIDVAEEKLKIGIRKKPGAKQ
jgi:hypothetical protein